MAVFPKIEGQELDRFWTLIEKPPDSADGCWIWKGESTGFHIQGRILSPRRTAWKIELPKNKPPTRLKPKCGTSACVRPQHMEQWPPRPKEDEAASAGQLRQIGSAVSMLLREQRLLGERVLALANKPAPPAATSDSAEAAIVVAQAGARALLDVRDQLAAVAERLDRIEQQLQQLQHAVPNGKHPPPQDQLGASLLSAFMRALGVERLDATNEDLDALRSVFDAAVTVGNNDAPHVFEGWLRRYAQLCARNPQLDPTPRELLRNLDLLAPEAAAEERPR